MAMQVHSCYINGSLSVPGGCQLVGQVANLPLGLSLGCCRPNTHPLPFVLLFNQSTNLSLFFVHPKVDKRAG